MKKIFFVEDDNAFYNLCAMELKNKGYETTHVPEGSSAVEKIISEKPDVILLDIVLPGMSGLDVLKELKDRDETKNIKVIMLTNFGTDENVSKSMSLGADDYLMKYNIVPSDLPDKIAAVLGDSKKSTVKKLNG
jgi:DNA-binding response OmpR family regulator